jgi:elongation factor G
MDVLPPPLVEVAVEPRAKADDEKLLATLSQMAAEDASFRILPNRESGQIILQGADEFHLDAKLDMLRQTYGIEVFVGQPQVAYCETITKRVEVDYTYKKLTGTIGEFAKVKMIFEPNERGVGNVFESKVNDSIVPDKYIPGVKSGINAGLGSGTLAGFPVVDTKATLIDGAYHEVDSSLAAFKIASRNACHDALRRAESKLLEPIMNVEIIVPEIYATAIIHDLRARRGRMQSSEQRADATTILAEVSMANMFGYMASLRSLTRGMGTFAMRFKEYRIIEISNPDRNPPPAAAAALRA